MKRNFILPISAFLYSLLLLSIPFSLAADTPATSEEQKLVEQENIRELNAIPVKPVPKGKLFSIKSGGWFTSLFRFYKNTDNDAGIKDLSAWSLYEDLRLWTRMTYHQDYSLYVRLKELYIRRDTSSLSSLERVEHQGPDLDMAYFAITKPGWKLPLDLTIGKQYLFVGRGITYSDVNYGVKYKTNFGKKLFVKAFYSVSDERSPNIDDSFPHYDKNNNRSFGSIEIAYAGIKNFVAYGYFLIQQDHNTRFPKETPTQSYRYNSQYYGLGLQGNNRKKNMEYWLEVIQEQGKDQADTYVTRPQEINIKAWASDLGVNYKFKAPLHPAVELEYAYGSGNKYRYSVVDTHYGGNRTSPDANFLYFGSFFAGYALSPRLSNLHIYKIDGSIRPFEKFKFGKAITCGAKYFLYRKDKKAGAIYDTDATQNSLDVGQEADAYLYWQLGKNIYWSNRFGIFFPGSAYPAKTNNNTQYYYTRLSIIF